MRTVADVSTDDLVNSLLNSVTSGASSTSTSDSTPSTSTTTTRTSAPSSASASESAASASASHSASSSSNDATSTKTTDAPETTSPATTAPPTAQVSASSSTGSGETATKGASEGSDSGGGGNGVGLSVGIAIGVLALVVATLLFLRSRRKRAQKARESAMSPPMGGATCLAVPADRGFKKEQELGMPEMSIELTPGELGMSKGFDMSYASSRSSATSQQYNPSIASSTDSSVFNTKGGVSPTFSNRKMASYSYQYRESEDNATNANTSSARSNDSTTFHLTGLIGNGATASGRGPSNAARAPGSRKLSAPDEYAELVTATNAHGHVDMNAQNQSPQVMQADFTQSATSQNDMGISMGPDNDNQSFLAPLPTRAAPAPAQPRQGPVIRASEESMGPDSPVAGRGKRTGSVYDTIPKLSGEKMSVSSRSSEEDPNAMSTASFLSESSISSTSTRDSAATSARGSAYVSSMPLLQQLSSADDSDYGEDYSSERASTESTDSANTTRSGSLIALNLEAKDGCSEIAI
ncbi:hypothetical protein P3T76_009616 [Phytophthora citrophthora]|uniref:Uncharacterized protein n=1 Tax=Phytophthora citrophthora TaxID=4793 RepID=A0AAD9GGA7_9STRA|nr:hypothetical protein P3T76_009616 [Phytophthora citrophthora]